MTTGADIGRYARTIAHLQPQQIGHRARLRAQRSIYQHRPAASLHAAWSHGVPDHGSWPADFHPIDRGVQHPAPDGSRFELIGERHDVESGDWRPDERSQLFRYHLHYMDWAWPIAGRDDHAAFARLWTSWRNATRLGRWDEWSPYVVALRSWTLCGVFDRLVAGRSIETDVINHQRAALGFLERNLELDVGGNHLIKDLKAIIGLAIFFDQPDRAGQALTRLVAELEHQVLDDGGHFELSPSYHAQVLADLIDIDELLAKSGAIPSPPTLGNTIAGMRHWLAVMSYGDGSLPLIGDCTPPPVGLLDALRAGSDHSEPSRVEHLEASGYVVVRPANHLIIVIDVGHPCPPELPAHAQADWGTFEIWAGGSTPRRVVADPGVSTYIGSRRHWERSTAAHNTIAIADIDTTEVWSSFRAAELAEPQAVTTSADEQTVRIEAELIGRPDHTNYRRAFTITGESMCIVDAVDPIQRGTSTITLPEAADECRVSAANPFVATPSDLATAFGTLEPALRVQQALVDGAATWSIDLSGLGS